MKITFFSDTHTKHDGIIFPEADVLVCTGDFTNVGKVHDVSEFAEFIQKQPHKHKIVIAGNHDFCFENEDRILAEKILTFSGITYLNDSGVTIDGIKFWGSPVQPYFGNWAFNRERGSDIKKHWDLIPNDTDILLTHGPAYGILDMCDNGLRVGCCELLKRIDEVRPKIHACGHIHEGYGIIQLKHTAFINSSILDESYTRVNEPITLEI
jgi:Icc-related predicted phosphoesterase